MRIIKIIILLIIYSCYNLIASDCKGKISFTEGDVKIKKPYDNILVDADFKYIYENPAIAGSMFSAKSNIKFNIPKIDNIRNIEMNIQKLNAEFTDPPKDCNYLVTEFPTNSLNSISVRRTEDNKLTFRGNFTLLAKFSISCKDQPISYSTALAGGQPGGLMITDIKPGATTIVCNNEMQNIGDTKWCATVTINSVSDHDILPEEIRSGESVQEGDIIETGSDGNVEITFPDRSFVRIGPNSSVIISSLTCKNAQRDEYNFHVSPGKIWSKVSDALGGDAKFNVTSNNAITGVRGTEFIVESTNDTINIKNPGNKNLSDYILDKNCNCYIKTTTTLSVIDGKVEFRLNEGELYELKEDMSEISKELEMEIKDLESELADEEDAAENERTKEMLKGLKKQLESNKMHNVNVQKSKSVLIQKGERSVILNRNEPGNPVKFKEDEQAWYSDKNFKK